MSIKGVKTAPILVFFMSVALSIAFGYPTTHAVQQSGQPPKASGALSSRRMLDGKVWTAQNLNVNTVPSYCYQDAE